MPKDFGDWLGEQPKLDFRDPTPDAPPKLDPPPSVVDRMAYAQQRLRQHQFKADPHRDTYVAKCMRCASHVEIPALDAVWYVDLCDAQTPKRSPALCYNCAPFVKPIPRFKS